MPLDQVYRQADRQRSEDIAVNDCDADWRNEVLHSQDDREPYGLPFRVDTVGSLGAGYQAEDSQSSELPHHSEGLLRQLERVHRKSADRGRDVGLLSIQREAKNCWTMAETRRTTAGGRTHRPDEQKSDGDGFLELQTLQCRGIVHVDYLATGKSINQHYYNDLLKTVREFTEKSAQKGDLSSGQCAPA